MPSPRQNELVAAVRAELGATSSPSIDPLVTADEMGVPVKVWSRAAKKGELRAARIAGKWRARKSDADAWIAKMLDARRREGRRSTRSDRGPKAGGRAAKRDAAGRAAPSIATAASGLAAHAAGESA